MRETQLEQYLDGRYAEDHPDWHFNDAPQKAEDLYPHLCHIFTLSHQSRLTVADVGTGVGAVPLRLQHLLIERKGCKVDLSGFELSPQAVARAAELHPYLKIHQRTVESGDGPFDVIMYVDVLEHLENPWEELRRAREVSKFLVVRQPLLGNFSTFRHDNYYGQRATWGHIGFFNYRSFIDMARTCGWQPRDVRLAAPWELWTKEKLRGHGHWWKRIVTRLSRTYASYFLTGFYLIGTFERLGASSPGEESCRES